MVTILTKSIVSTDLTCRLQKGLLSGKRDEVK